MTELILSVGSIIVLGVAFAFTIWSDRKLDKEIEDDEHDPYRDHYWDDIKI